MLRGIGLAEIEHLLLENEVWIKWKGTSEDIHQFHVLFLHSGVPMIFDGVISSSRQHLCHLRPFVAMGSVGKEQHPLLMRHPLDLQDTWVKVVMPALATLLPQASLNELSDEGPTLWTVLLHQLAHQVVLLLRPRLLPQEARAVVVGLYVRVVVILLHRLVLVAFLYHFKSTLFKNNGDFQYKLSHKLYYARRQAVIDEDDHYAGPLQSELPQLHRLEYFHGQKVLILHYLVHARLLWHNSHWMPGGQFRWVVDHDSPFFISQFLPSTRFHTLKQFSSSYTTRYPPFKGPKE